MKQVSGMRPREDVWEYRAVLAVDIVGSGGRGNVALQQIRSVLATALRESFEVSGIDWEACLRDDLGDGFRVTAPAGVRKPRLIHPLIPELAARLRAHNRTAGEKTSIRVRTALHAGDVCIGWDGGVTGRPLEVLARLLDAAPARAALAEAPDSVAASLLVSQHYYEETVPHGYPGLDPETFREVAVAEKEFTAPAWLHLSGYGSPAHESARASAQLPEPRESGPREPGQPGRHAAPAPTAEVPGSLSEMINKASGHGTVYATQNGIQHIHITGKP